MSAKHTAIECKICKGNSPHIFSKELLQKYLVDYYRCLQCGFMQTEAPYWISEAYSKALSPLDVYLISRPIELGDRTKNVILNYFDNTAKFLDFGGGAGVLTRHMRDRGFNFYRFDRYAENIFANYFDVSDLDESERKFELVTCFEVLEHFENPMNDLKDVFEFSKNVLCSTQLQPGSSVDQLSKWDYLGELHGQHISFYTKESMRRIAQEFGCNFYSDGMVHLFTEKKINSFRSYRSIPMKIASRLRRLASKITSEIEKSPPNTPLTIKDSIEVAKKIKRAI